MAFIRKRRSWTSQPQEAVELRRDGAVQSGIISLISPLHRLDAVVPSRPITIASNTKALPTSDGIAWSNSASGNDGIIVGSGGWGNFIPTSDPITFICRAYVGVLSTRQVLFADWSSGGTSESIAVEATAGNTWRAYSDGSVRGSGGAVTLGWHNFVVTQYANQSVDVWVDGVLTISASASSFRLAGDTAKWLGSGAYSGSIGWRGAASILAVSTAPADQAFATEFNDAPWSALFAPQSIWVPVSAGGGGPTPAGTATETDASLTLSGVQLRAVGQAAETDAAQALVAVQIASTGRADETETALALTPVQITVAGLASETDAALALDPGATGAVGVALETDVAMALAAVQISTVGAASEADSALALDAVVGTAPGIAQETDTALALAAVQIAAVGISEETDAALAPGSADLAEVVSLGGARPKPRMRRQRIQDYDVPLPPEVLTSTIPHDTPPTGIKPAPSLSAYALRPASKLATRPARVKAPKAQAPAPAPVATPESQATPAVAIVPVVAAAAPVSAAAKPPRAMALADILSAQDLTHDELLQAVKLLARELQDGPALRLVRSHRIALRR